MAQSGFTPIQLYRTTTASTVPTAGNLADGELAINTNDGRLFYKDNGGVVQTIGWKNVPVSAGGTGATTAAVALTNLGAVAKAGDTMTGVLAVVGGTVSAPGIAFSGDTNTGIYSPAADTIAFTEGGTEVLRLDSSGNATFAGTAVMASSFQRNRIINGNMYIAQRATSATVTAGTGVPTASTGYPCVDRFFVYSTGANVTAAQVAASGATPVLLRITGAASVTAVGVGQRIEAFNSTDLAGQTCTLSVDLANSLLTTVTWTASYANTADTFGTIGTPTKTQIATGTFTVTSTLTRYSVNISVPSAATTGIEILFTVGAQTSGTWGIDNVQFEAGTVATPFERRQYGQEFALCQRYYEKSYALATVPGTAPGAGSATYNSVASSGAAVNNFPFNVRKRANPTMTFYDGAGNAGVVSYYVSSWLNNGAITIGNGYQSSLFIQTNIVSSIQINFDWTASAEL